MKPLVLALALILAPIAAKAQTVTNPDATHRLQDLEDRAALKALVDTFSNLADTKEIDKQVMLFTEDATVESISEGRPNPALKGRKQIGEAFGSFLALFEVVYHINGQQTVEIDGDHAKGVAYCQVVLIGRQDGKRVRTTMGVTYHDDYTRQDGQWLIARRTSNFVWTNREVVAE